MRVKLVDGIMKMVVIKVLLFLSMFSTVYADLNVAAAFDVACALVASDVRDKEVACEHVLSRLRGLEGEAGTDFQSNNWDAR